MAGLERLKKAAQGLTKILRRGVANQDDVRPQVEAREDAPLKAATQDVLGAYILGGLQDYTDQAAIRDLLIVAPPTTSGTIRCDITMPTEEQARTMHELGGDKGTSLVKIFDETLTTIAKKKAKGERPEPFIWRTLNGPRYIIEKKLGEGGMGGAYLAYKVGALDISDDVKSEVRNALLKPVRDRNENLVYGSSGLDPKIIEKVHDTMLLKKEIRPHEGPHGPTKRDAVYRGLLAPNEESVDKCLNQIDGWDLYGLHEKLKEEGRVDDRSYREELDAAVKRELTNKKVKHRVIKVELANAAESKGLQSEIGLLTEIKKSVFLAQVYDAELDLDTRMLAMSMEFIDGESLRTRLNRHINAGALPSYEHTALDLNHIAQGIIALHQHGRRWGDCKPDNVMIDANCQIIDFGLSGKNYVEGIAGTATHLAPEGQEVGGLGKILSGYHALKNHALEDGLWADWRKKKAEARKLRTRFKEAKARQDPQKDEILKRLQEAAKRSDDAQEDCRAALKKATDTYGSGKECRHLPRPCDQAIAATEEQYANMVKALDAYALGALGYEMLTGVLPTPPYKNQGPDVLLMRKLMHKKNALSRRAKGSTYNKLLKPHEINPAVPEKLSELVYALLNPEWQKRMAVTEFEDKIKGLYLFDGAVRISGFSMPGIQAYRDKVLPALSDPARLEAKALGNPELRSLEPLVLARHRNDVYATTKQEWIEPDDKDGNGWSRMPKPATKSYTQLEHNPAAKAHALERVRKNDPSQLEHLDDGLDYRIGAGVCRIREDVGPAIGKFMLDMLVRRVEDGEATDAERKHYATLCEAEKTGPYGVFDQCVNALNGQFRNIHLAAQEELVHARRDHELLASVEDVLHSSFTGESVDIMTPETTAQQWDTLLGERKARYHSKDGYEQHRAIKLVYNALNTVGGAPAVDAEGKPMDVGDLLKEAYSFVKQWRMATDEYMTHLDNLPADANRTARTGLAEGALLRVYLHNLETAPVTPVDPEEQ